MTNFLPRSPSGFTLTWGRRCTAGPSLQGAPESGTSPGPCLTTPPSPSRPINWELPWRVVPHPGSSTGNKNHDTAIFETFPRTTLNLFFKNVKNTTRVSTRDRPHQVRERVKRGLFRKTTRGQGAVWRYHHRASLRVSTKLRTYIYSAVNLSLHICDIYVFVWCRYLKYTLDPSKIRKQDATSTIIYVANNVVGQPLAWDFIRANWEYIYREWVSRAHHHAAVGLNTHSNSGTVIHKHLDCTDVCSHAGTAGDRSPSLI